MPGVMARTDMRRYRHDNYTIFRLIPEGQIGSAFAIQSSATQEILLIDAWGPLNRSKVADVEDVEQKTEILDKLAIPYLPWLEAHCAKVVGIVITHLHRDHIQALASLLYHLGDLGFHPDIICSGLTAQFLEAEFNAAGLLFTPEMANPFEHSEPMTVGKAFRITAKPTCHSTLGAISCLIEVQGKYDRLSNIVALSDFKRAAGPLTSQEAAGFDQFLADVSQREISALITEILNCDRPGYAPSLTTVVDTVRALIANHQGRIYFSCFSTDFERIIEVAKLAHADGRTVEFEGRTMQFSQTLMQSNDLLPPNPESVSVLDKIRRKFVFLTGGQGEPQSGTYGYAFSKRKAVSEEDAFIFSCDPIPGNEEAYCTVVYRIALQGAQVIVSRGGNAMFERWLKENDETIEQQQLKITVADVHVTGHEYREGLIDTILKINPRDLFIFHHLPPNKVMAASELLLLVAKRAQAEARPWAFIPSPFHIMRAIFSPSVPRELDV